MPKTGGLSPLPRESCSPESEACLCSPIHIYIFLILRSSSTATRNSHTCAAIRSRALWTLPVTSCSCTCTSSLMDGTIRQGFNPSCRIPTTRAAMTSPCASPKANLAVRGVHHASTCALLVRNLCRALCEQNTLRRPRRVSHTRSRREPVQSKSSYPAWLLSVRGIG